MSSSIWTRCGRRTERLTAAPWRAVEAQHLISTRVLVDSDAEHALLEELIEASKPALPARPDLARLQFLLATPFRYPPLPHGSRFGARQERGIWYGADTVETALAEVAYYRLLFLAGTTAALVPITLRWSLFQAQVEAEPGADLSRPPFALHRRAISSPVSYESSQRLGAAMRADGVRACRYFSARDPGGGTNLAVFDPAAFSRRTPSRDQKWFCSVAPEGVDFTKDDLLAGKTVSFPRAAFLVDGRLPHPAL